MTINKLYKLLHHLVVTGHGRMHVCIDKATFHHNCEGDGSPIINRDGSERVRTALVLDGGYAVTVETE